VSLLRRARTHVAQTLADELGGVPVLEFEPRGDLAGSPFVTVRVVGADNDNVDIEVTATDVLRADRASQDTLDVLVDDIDLAMPPGVFLQGWRFDFDDDDGAIRAVGTFRAPRYAGWCDPAPATATTALYQRGHI